MGRFVVHADLYRQASETEPSDRRRRLPPRASVARRVDFSTNDYLSFSGDPRLHAATARAARRFGLGATGSRLLSGNTRLHEAFERRIARDLATEAALLFPSGYQLNVAVLSSLLDRKTLGGEAQLFTDRLIHASLHHGAQLAGVREQRFRHNDLQHLELLLQKASTESPRFIVTESLFGMEGDLTDLKRLRALARAYHALLCIDDSHAIGLYGRSGFGLIDDDHEQKPREEQLVILGTLSKALGGLGGYVACSSTIKDYLIQKCGGFIYSTALAPPLVAAAWTAWRELPHRHAQRAHIQSLSKMLREGLTTLDLKYGNSTSHIVPIIFGDDRRILEIKEGLHVQGFLVAAIRPPTVPNGQARLRLALCAHHQREDIESFLTALKHCL